MATATTNKLPEFATKPQDNTFDTEIIDKSSELEDTGFVPNTTICSSQMNTYMKMMIESLRGIVDGLYRQAAAQGEIKANSTAQDWQNYIQKGLTDLITKTNVNNAANANACSGNAASATKLKNARTLNISGDATGTAQSFDGTANVTIPVDVKKSAALDSTNIGDATHPVYFDANGKPVKVNQKIANDTSGKADTAGTADVAIKLQTPRNIALTGDVIGNANFDGSSNIEIETSTTIVNAKSMVTDAGGLLGVGGLQKPVYFADGKPVKVNMFKNLGKIFLTKQSNGKYTMSLFDTTHFLAFVEVGAESGDVYLSGIAEFNSGAIVGMISGSFMLDQTGSGSFTAFVNTVMYSTKNPAIIHVEGQAVNFDGTISNDVSYKFIRITKLYQID